MSAPFRHYLDSLTFSFKQADVQYSKAEVGIINLQTQDSVNMSVYSALEVILKYLNF